MHNQGKRQNQLILDHNTANGRNINQSRLPTGNLGSITCQ